VNLKEAVAKSVAQNKNYIFTDVDYKLVGAFFS
jgi:hypothetical protein